MIVVEIPKTRITDQYWEMDSLLFKIVRDYLLSDWHATEELQDLQLDDYSQLNLGTSVGGKSPTAETSRPVGRRIDATSAATGFDTVDPSSWNVSASLISVMPNSDVSLFDSRVAPCLWQPLKLRLLAPPSTIYLEQYIHAHTNPIMWIVAKYVDVALA